MEDRDLYEEAKQKGKFLLIGFVSALILIGLILMIVKIVENANQPKPPVLELKLYDENWVELEKKNSSDYIRLYDFDYDGNPKGFNAILYMNDSVLMRYDFTGEKNHNSSGLKISYFKYYDTTTGYDRDYIEPPIIEKGEYQVEIGINTWGSSIMRFKSEDGRESITRGELTDLHIIIHARSLNITIK